MMLHWNGFLQNNLSCRVTYTLQVSATPCFQLVLDGTGEGNPEQITGTSPNMKRPLPKYSSASPSVEWKADTNKTDGFA